MFWQEASQTRQFEVHGRILHNVFFASHPSEPTFQGYEHPVLRAEAKRFAVLLAIVEKMPSVTFQQSWRNVTRTVYTLIGTPAYKDFELIPSCFDCLFRILLDQ